MSRLRAAIFNPQTARAARLLRALSVITALVAGAASIYLSLLVRAAFATGKSAPCWQQPSALLLLVVAAVAAFNTLRAERARRLYEEGY